MGRLLAYLLTLTLTITLLTATVLALNVKVEVEVADGGRGASVSMEAGLSQGVVEGLGSAYSSSISLDEDHVAKGEFTGLSRSYRGVYEGEVKYQVEEYLEWPSGAGHKTTVNATPTDLTIKRELNLTGSGGVAGLKTVYPENMEVYVEAKDGWSGVIEASQQLVVKGEANANERVNLTADKGTTIIAGLIGKEGLNEVKVTSEGSAKLLADVKVNGQEKAECQVKLNRAMNLKVKASASKESVVGDVEVIVKDASNGYIVVNSTTQHSVKVAQNTSEVTLHEYSTQTTILNSKGSSLANITSSGGGEVNIYSEAEANSDEGSVKQVFLKPIPMRGVWVVEVEEGEGRLKAQDLEVIDGQLIGYAKANYGGGVVEAETSFSAEGVAISWMPEGSIGEDESLVLIDVDTLIGPLNLTVPYYKASLNIEEFEGEFRAVNVTLPPRGFHSAYSVYSLAYHEQASLQENAPTMGAVEFGFTGPGLSGGVEVAYAYSAISTTETQRAITIAPPTTFNLTVTSRVGEVDVEVEGLEAKKAIILEPYYLEAVVAGPYDYTAGDAVFGYLAEYGLATWHYIQGGAKEDRYQGLDEYSVAVVIGHMDPSNIYNPYSEDGAITSEELDEWYSSPATPSPLILLVGCESLSGHPGQPSDLAQAVYEAVENGGLVAGFNSTVLINWTNVYIPMLIGNMTVNGLSFQKANQECYEYALNTGLIPSDVAYEEWPYLEVNQGLCTYPIQGDLFIDP